MTQLLNHYLTEMSEIALHRRDHRQICGGRHRYVLRRPDDPGVKEDALACVKMAIAMQKDGASCHH